MTIQVPKKLTLTIFPKTPQERQTEVAILAVHPLVVFPEPMTPRQTLAITYQRETLPPRVIWIDKEKYSEAVLKETLRADIEGTYAPPQYFAVS